MRSRGATRRSAIICLLDRRDEGRAAMALDLGAADLVRDDFEPEETALRLNQHLRRKHAADRRRASLRDSLTLAVTDPLTGLHNRRYALANLASLTGRSDGSAEAGALAVFLLDLDGFKAVNDAWGHPAGDAVLVEVAQRLRQCLSPGDLVARIGGEEFLVARPSCTESTALDLAHALRLAVAAAPVQLEDRKAWVEVTLSVGVALADPDPAKRTALSDNHTATPAPETATRPGPDEAAARAATLIAQADRALLASKTGGRNRVTLYRRALSDPPGPIRSFGT